jgi:hypothetical protein
MFAFLSVWVVKGVIMSLVVMVFVFDDRWTPRYLNVFSRGSGVPSMVNVGVCVSGVVEYILMTHFEVFGWAVVV